jgi:hypothetical protein
MANGVSEMLWLERILEELRMPVNMPIKLYCDNKVVISIAHNPVQHDHCTRHVEIDKHFKKKIDSGVLFMHFVPTTQQIVDIFTKDFLDLDLSFVSKLGMINIYAPT